MLNSGLLRARPGGGDDATPGGEGEDKINSYEDITSYTTTTSSGTDKEDPKANAQHAANTAWTVHVTGLVKKQPPTSSTT